MPGNHIGDAERTKNQGFFIKYRFYGYNEFKKIRSSKYGALYISVSQNNQFNCCKKIGAQSADH